MIRLITAFTVFAFAATSTLACELTMGYRTNAKKPFIEESPNNSGMYLELFELAAGKIGCTVKVVREPKARVIDGLDRGRVDFYPGYTFSEKREKTTLFLENGLKDGYIGITRKGEAQITSVQQLADRNLVYLVSVGGFDLNAGDYGVTMRQPRDAAFGDIVKLITKKQGDFHAYNVLTVNYYLRNNPDIADQLEVHPDCCGGFQPMHFGFSKQSKHTVLVDNPNYDSSAPLSAENTPKVVQAGSVPDRLTKALAEIKESGELEQLYIKYFGRAIK